MPYPYAPIMYATDEKARMNVREEEMEFQENEDKPSIHVTDAVRR
jgi:hypothetical protein